MKKITALLLSLVLVFSLTGCSSVSKDVVAKVNSRVITLAEYNKSFSLFKYQIESMYGPDIWTKDSGSGKTYLEQAKTSILNAIVDDELINQAASKEGIKADTKNVDSQFKQFKDNVDKNAALKKYLKDNNIDDEFIKDKISKQDITAQYKEKFMKTVNVSDAKLKENYDKNIDKYKKEEVKASHILLKIVDDQMKPLAADVVKKAEATANDLLVRIKNGEDFASLAKQYSQDPGSAKNGGDLGYFGRGVMVKVFEDTAFGLKKGEVSGVVKSEFGYHIIKAEDKRENVQKFEEVKTSILSQMQEDSFKEKIKSLEKDGKVEKFEKNIK